MNDTPSDTPRCRASLWARLRDVLILLLLIFVAAYAGTEWSESCSRRQAVERHLERGLAAVRAGELVRARVAVEAARALAPGDPDVQTAMMAYNVRRAAELPHTLRAADLDALGYALDCSPDYADLGSKGEALKWYSPPVTKVARGQLALERGRTEAALELFEEARKTDPEYVHAHLAAARLLREAGKKLEALQALEAAVKAAPTNITALNNLGVHYAELDRGEDAMAVYQRAIEATDNASTRLNMADTLAKAKRTTEALEHLKRAAALAPDSPEVFRRLGTLLQSGGNLAGAEKMLLRSLDLQKDTQTAFNLGVLYQQQERYDRAASIFRQILEARPDSYPAAYALGATLRALGDAKGATAALRHYLSLAQQIPSEQERVAEVRGALGLSKPVPAPPAPVPAPAAPAGAPSPATPAPPPSSSDEGAR